MPCNRSDVVLVLYPHADLRTAKKRPALVVQSDNVETGLPQRIVVMITSNVARSGPTRVHVRRESPEGKAMGILMDSVIVTDNLATCLWPVLARLTFAAAGTCHADFRSDAIDALP
ncbi:MAG: type II toxin-antitoxin system PemK/MazF family toxin [Nitrospira sp.]|nr:MAG: type II toxin-antitoxin system PemK/MazF family toxin [Nitrospira sp.]